MPSEYKTEAEVCQDAIDINEGGACNPVAISGMLHQAIKFYGENGWDCCKHKPAIRLMLHQLTFLLTGTEGMYNDLPAGQSWRRDIDSCKKIIRETEEAKKAGLV